MSKRSPKSVEEKFEAVIAYLEQGQSISSLTRQFSVNEITIRNWVRRYKQDGIDGLKESRTWKKYSSELKKQAVKDYLDGRGSLPVIVEKYNISSDSVLLTWIKRYTRYQL